jgi:thiol-disulfide isomerase/thioredoxin
MNELILLFRVVLAALFLTAAIAKFRDRSGARKTAMQFGVPGSLARAVAVLLPAAELAGAAALLAARTAWSGAVGLLTLLAAFTIAMAVAMARGRSVECRCFGQAHAAPVGPATLVRNLVLAGMAAAIVSRGSEAGGSLAGALAGLNGGQMLNLLLGLIIVGGVYALTQVLKQYGKLLVRVELLERQVAAEAAAPAPPGLPVGSPAPAFSLTRLGDGKALDLDVLSARAKKVLLVFISPGCPACDQLLPDLAAWQREHRGHLAIALIGRDEAKTQKKVARHGFDTVLIQEDQEVEALFRIEVTPSAVLVRDRLIASPTAAGRDAIEALVTDATMPPPVKKGDLVPSVKLPLLDGGSLDLGDLPGRALMLFWNPSCGFCQQMLSPLKEWEREAADYGLGLIVASSGPIAEVRALGFTSPVILDKTSSVMRVFGATGTPSAILVEAGRVVSNVEASAPAVWKLVGAKQAVPA